MGSRHSARVVFVSSIVFTANVTVTQNSSLTLPRWIQDIKHTERSRKSDITQPEGNISDEETLPHGPVTGGSSYERPDQSGQRSYRIKS